MAPRPDENVTKSYKHLIKVPLSVHPSTGLIALPFPLHAEASQDITSVQMNVSALCTGETIIGSYYEAAVDHLTQCTSEITHNKN